MSYMSVVFWFAHTETIDYQEMKKRIVDDMTSIMIRILSASLQIPKLYLFWMWKITYYWQYC
jgi:hypothetical protein